jgi:uncharacterized protein YidB (DUF937 family)
MGLRAIARETGLSISKVSRLRELTPEQVAAVTPENALPSFVVGDKEDTAQTTVVDRIAA